MKTQVATLQGPLDVHGVSLSPDTLVALTMKHFPGGGPQELGLDQHYAFGYVERRRLGAVTVGLSGRR